MYKYRTRPGYGSKKLLIEFMTDTGNEEFVNTFKSVLLKHNIKVKYNEELLFTGQINYTMLSDAGEFDIVTDNWGCLFIHAENNQNVISYLENIFSQEESFIKEIVNFEDYKKIPEKNN